MKKLREAVGTAADLVTIGLLLVAAAGGIAYWLRNATVRGWVLALTVGALLLLAVLLQGLFRWRTGRGLAARLKLAADDLTVATSYLSNVDDFLVGIRECFAAANLEEAMRRLDRLRSLILDAVIQGINSARSETVRCVYFTPVDEERGPVLRPQHYHGHGPRVEQVLWLWADARSAAGAAFSTRGEVYVPNAPNDPRVQQVPAGGEIGSLLCIPAFGPDNEEPVGVFSVASTRKEAFTRSDREFASVCANLLALVDFLAATFKEGAAQVDADR